MKGLIYGILGFVALSFGMTVTAGGNCPASITVACTGSDYSDSSTKVSKPWFYFSDPCPFTDENKHFLKLHDVLSSSQTDVSPTGYSFRCFYKGDKPSDEIQIVTIDKSIQPAPGPGTNWKKSDDPNIEYVCEPKDDGSGCPHT